MKSSLIILCLNEYPCLLKILPQINQSWFDEVVIIDGGSTDGSIAYAESLGFNVRRQSSRGVLEGIREGIATTQGEIIVFFTPDGNMLPEKLPVLVAKMREGFDMVTVSRYKDGAKSTDDSLLSAFGNWFFTRLVNVLFGSKFTDLLGFYRAIRRDIFQKTELEGFEVSRAINTQLSIRAWKRKLKIAEISGDEPPRIAGKSVRRIWFHGTMELLTILEEFFIGIKPIWFAINRLNRLFNSH